MRWIPVGFAWAVACSSPTPPPAEPALVSASPDAAVVAEPIARDAAPDAVAIDPYGVLAIPDDALVTASGLGFRRMVSGAGLVSPTAADRVEIRYETWAGDGSPQATTNDRTETVAMKALDAAWQEALLMMKSGDLVRLWIADSVGVGVVDIELVRILPGASFDVSAPPVGAKKTAKGVEYVVVTRGKGKIKPKATDLVDVHYVGWTTDGNQFDSSRERDAAASFAVDKVIPGWTDVLVNMRVGDLWRVWIPEELGYEGRAGVPGGVLVFEIELLAVTRVPPPPKAPRDVAKPPKSAKQTESGLFYRFLSRGPKGGAQPGADARVEVRYSMWTAVDGKLIDSSISRGRSATFPLDAVIPGWREGIMLMRVGDRIRVWIPEDLAYQGQDGKPAGMLVSDVELLAID